jgi:hypothetical protein
VNGVRSLILAASLLLGAQAFAAEPSGCDKFAWPLAAEQKLLGEAQRAPAAADLDRDAAKAVELDLVPLTEAGLPMAPERAPQKTPALAGYLRFGKGAGPRLYKVTLSDGAWIDLVQDGHYLKPGAFTGATDCPHVRKSVKFEIGPAPFTLQVSGAAANHIAVVITPAE